MSYMNCKKLVLIEYLTITHTAAIYPQGRKTFRSTVNYPYLMITPAQ